MHVHFCFRFFLFFCICFPLILFFPFFSCYTFFTTYLIDCFINRMIPENIHTIPRVASWNSEGEGEFLGLEFQRHFGGGNTVWNSKGLGGVQLWISRGKMAKASLEIADLLTFLVCKSGTNRPRKQDAEVSIHADEWADGFCSKLHIERGLKVDE